MSPSEAGAAGAGTDPSGADLDALIARILTETETIAVIGMKDDPQQDAGRIPQYMAEAGYRIVPVNPKLEQALGQPAYPDLRSVSEAGVTVELVDVFRASEHVEGHVDDILAMEPRPKAVWLQLGIHHGPSARRLREAGIDVVQDRCVMVDHRRMADRIGRASSAPRTDGG